MPKLAAPALLVPKDVVPAMRAGDPECLSALPEEQRLEIQAAARAVAELGSGVHHAGRTGWGEGGHIGSYNRKYLKITVAWLPQISDIIGAC
jgi:hypothetical protein